VKAAVAAIAGLAAAAIARCKDKRAAGCNDDLGYSLHHIVAQGAWQAQPARDILATVNIGINSSYNTIVVPNSLHYYIHTTQYYAAVNDAVGAAYDGGAGGPVAARRRVIGVLESIGLALDEAG
jgi:hypothetical protein